MQNNRDSVKINLWKNVLKRCKDFFAASKIRFLYVDLTNIKIKNRWVTLCKGNYDRIIDLNKPYTSAEKNSR